MVWFFRELKGYGEKHFINHIGLSDQQFKQIKKKYLKESKKPNKKDDNYFSFKYVGIIYIFEKLFIIYPKYIDAELDKNTNIDYDIEDDYKNKIVNCLKSIEKYQLSDKNTEEEGKEKELIRDKIHLNKIISTYNSFSKKTANEDAKKYCLSKIKNKYFSFLKKIKETLNWNITEDENFFNMLEKNLDQSIQLPINLNTLEKWHISYFNGQFNNFDKFIFLIDSKRMEYLWEKVYLDFLQSDGKNIKIPKEKAREIKTEDNKIIEPLEWKINNKENYSDSLRPDIVIEDDWQNLYIHDLKYYNILSSDGEIKKKPNKQDILKQYLYELTFKELGYEVKENWLIFPCDFIDEQDKEQKNINNYVFLTTFKNVFYYQRQKFELKKFLKNIVWDYDSFIKKIKIILYDANDLFSRYASEREDVYKVYKKDCQEIDFSFVGNVVKWTKSSRYTWIKFNYEIKEKSKEQVRFSFTIRDVRKGHEYTQNGNISLKIPQNK